jgi:hypothetical protein
MRIRDSECIDESRTRDQQQQGNVALVTLRDKIPEYKIEQQQGYYAKQERDYPRSRTER